MKSLTDKQMDILIILSDNQGHAEWDLAKKLDNFSSNLDEPLDNLKKEIVRGPFFSILDIRDPVNLAAKFRDPNYPVIDYLKGHLTRDSLDHWIPSEVNDNRQCIADFLNRLLLVHNLIDAKWFKNIELSETIQETIKQNPQSMSLRWLNRILLEKAFSNEVEKSQKSIIIRDKERDTTNKKSRHPKQPEFPYYINQDPNIFIYILNNIYSELRQAKQGVESLSDLEYETSRDIMIQAKTNLYSEEQLKKVMEDNISNIFDKASYYGNKGSKLKKILHDLLVSQYTKNLIKTYGLEVVLEIISKINAISTEDLDFYSSSLAEMISKNKSIFKENEIQLAEKLISRFQKG
jgi:hypothetical protein